MGCRDPYGAIKGKPYDIPLARNEERRALSMHCDAKVFKALQSLSGYKCPCQVTKCEVCSHALLRVWEVFTADMQTHMLYAF